MKEIFSALAILTIININIYIAVATYKKYKEGKEYSDEVADVVSPFGFKLYNDNPDYYEDD